MRGDRSLMRLQATYTPAQRAAEYLKRVAALTGAERVRDGAYWLRAGHRDFLVEYKFVRVVSRHSKSTCFSLVTDPGTPSAEVVASALLQLKNNPKLFKKWRKEPGRTFKSDGKMFRDLYRLGRDET